MADENLNNALNSINQAGGAAQQLAEMLQAASRSSARQTTATDVARDSMREFDRAQNNVRSGMMGMVNTLQGLASSLVSVGASAYTADKAFTGMVPALDAMGAALRGTFDALGKMGSGLSIAGFSFGQASEGVAAAAKVYADVLFGALKFQLDAAQSVADKFIELSAAGAVFGGGISEIKKVLQGPMPDVAGVIGLPLQEFTKIITQNAEAIASFGSGMKAGGAFLAGMGKKIFYTNQGLAALYGSVTELSKGTADYLSLQSQLGIDVTKNFDRSMAGAEEYLMRQRELSAITGKTAETLKREEEGRRKQLDYNLKLGRLGDEAQQNVKEGMAIAGKMFGDSGAKYAEEYFATGGNVYTKEALAYQAMNQEAASTIEGMLSGINQSRVAFRENAAKTFQTAAPALEEYAKSMEEYSSINRAANNSTIKGMTDTASAIQAALPAIRNLYDVFSIIEADREKISKGLDEPLKTFVEANKALLANRMQMDSMVIDSMSKMRDLVKALYDTQLAFIQAQPDAIQAFNDLKTAGRDTSKILKEFGNRLAELMGFQATATTPPTNQNPRTQSAPSGASNVNPSSIPGIGAGDVAPNISPFSNRNPQLQPDSGSPPPTSERRSQSPADNPVVAVLSTMPTKTDAERMNRDVLDALNRLTNVMA